MKRFFVFAFAPLVLLSTACERHRAAELPPEDEAGEHAEGRPVGGEPKIVGHEGDRGHAHEAQPEDPQKTTTESKPGEAPKFFPSEKK